MQDRAEQGMGLNYRRRVVYRALRACFADESRARRHFTLWNREFATQPHVALSRFVSAVAREDMLDNTARGRLQRALYEGLSLRYEQLAWVPDDWMPAANHTGEFPAVCDGVADARGSAPPAARADAQSEMRGEVRGEARTAMRAEAGVAAPHAPASGASAPPPPGMPATAAQTGAPAIERADRVLFHALARPLTAAVLAETDPHPGLLTVALADLAHALDVHEGPAHARLAAWADARFIDRDLPVMPDLDGYRTLLTLLRRLLADLGGDAVADHLLAAALVEAAALPQARLCPPLLLI